MYNNVMKKGGEFTGAELKTKSQRAKKIIKDLKKLFPEARIALNFKNSWELLVAVQLSAQCTDKKVNEVTPALFKKYKKFADYLKADPREFERMVRPTGFYKNKSKNILAAAKYIDEKYGGKLPKTMEEMVKVPGIGRKSANVILGNAYGIVDGIAVDTHVKRLSKKFGLTDHIDPVKIERDLMKLMPREEWFGFTYRIIDFGRKYCVARPHDHRKHPLGDMLKDG